MIYSRLKLSRNLLRDDGVIFVSIGDDEQANLKKICDEIFGQANFLGCACRVSKKANNQGDYWAPNFDYVLSYAKNRLECLHFFGGVNYKAYKEVDSEGARAGEQYQLLRLYMTSLDPMRGCTNQRYYIKAPDGTLLIPPGNVFPNELEDGAGVPPKTGEDKVWRWKAEKYKTEQDRIVVQRVSSSNLIDSNGNSVKWNVFTKTYLNDVIKNATAKPNSLIENHINQNSSHELGKLEIPFSFAKPSSLIKFLCEISGVKGDDIVMDFFAGSGSTAHAVLDLNASTSSNVRFILVQVAEELQYDDKNQKAGFIFCEKMDFKKTIPEITKERIRRVGTMIRAENPDDEHTKKLDVGFRVLKLDSSNMKDIFYTPDAIEQGQLKIFTDNIKPDRSPEDLLFQVLLDWGVDLSLPIRREIIQNKSVFFVDDNALLACFEADTNEEFFRYLAQFAPLRVVLRDSGFSSDSEKINVEQIFKQLSPGTEVKSI
jgi:adenine-specific DNA-methyltransferase